ncbi:MAG: PstS family phosphate ABC transporter substrate-binding protein [Candidatus Aminicenantes bacterium]|nr:PstS family phosphate ABC transporter substrate-binding protein [Candidatus Aminicenantes bacterium]
MTLAAKKTITIKGSTTVLPIAQSCAEAFMNTRSDIDISVQGGGSGVGIASAIDGTADIGDASRPAKDKEFAKAKENGIELYENVVAMDGIAVIVHPSNSCSALTKDQIKDIYTGKISDWKELGGKKGKIVVVSRDSASGTFETFNELALDKEKVRPDALLNASNRAVATTIATTPQAIGYVGLGYLTDDVKGVQVNGIKPTKDNVVNGSYALSRKLFMYTNGAPKGAVKEFLDYVMSSEGQKLVDKAGFVAIK